MPRFILRNFTEQKDQVWVLDKQNNRKFKTNIKNIASENGFYNFEIDGHQMTFETSISDFEGEASRIIKKIINSESIGSLTDEDKVVMSHFVALQYVRTKQWRETWKSMDEALTKAIREKGMNPEDMEGYRELTDEANKLEHMRSIHKADEFAPHFHNKDWVLLKATNKQSFWISDNPISLQNSIDRGFYGNIGLAVKGIEIYFPLSKELTLGMWCPSHQELINKKYGQYKFLKNMAPDLIANTVGDPKYIEQLIAGFEEGIAVPSYKENIINHNSLQVRYASRFVYSCNDDFDLAEEMIKSYPNLREGPKMQVS